MSPLTTKIQSAIRIDGAKRIDLKARREKRGVSLSPISPVSLCQKELKRAREREHRTVRRLLDDDGGKEGAKLSHVRIKISGNRTEKQIVRCRPGDFTWRYGRNKQDALFHAGSHFAQLWERAGATVASSVDFLRGTRSGYVTGMAEGRVAAIDCLYGVVADLGRFSVSRLIAYCVEGMTSAEIARRDGMTEREASTVLHADLRACAMHFNFV